MTDHTIAHELIHAYDQCRVKLDRSNCLHVACTEVLKYMNIIDCVIVRAEPHVVVAVIHQKYASHFYATYDHIIPACIH